MSYFPGNAALTETNIVLQGSTYVRDFLLTVSGSPLDLSPWVGASKGVRCQFRAGTADVQTTILCTPTMAIVSPATDGRIRMTIDSVTTQALVLESGGQYDIELFDNTVSPPLVERVVQGAWGLSKEVTR